MAGQIISVNSRSARPVYRTAPNYSTPYAGVTEGAIGRAPRGYRGPGSDSGRAGGRSATRGGNGQRSNQRHAQANGHAPARSRVELDNATYLAGALAHAEKAGAALGSSLGQPE